MTEMTKGWWIYCDPKGKTQFLQVDRYRDEYVALPVIGLKQRAFPVTSYPGQWLTPVTPDIVLQLMGVSPHGDRNEDMDGKCPNCHSYSCAIDTKEFLTLNVKPFDDATGAWPDDHRSMEAWTCFGCFHHWHVPKD